MLGGPLWKGMVVMVPAQGVVVLQKGDKGRKGAPLHEPLLHWRIILYRSRDHLRSFRSKDGVPALQEAQQGRQATNHG